MIPTGVKTPPESYSAKISVSMTPTMKTELTVLAAQKGLSVSALVRDLITAALDG